MPGEGSRASLHRHRALAAGSHHPRQGGLGRLSVHMLICPVISVCIQPILTDRHVILLMGMSEDVQCLLTCVSNSNIFQMRKPKLVGALKMKV